MPTYEDSNLQQSNSQQRMFEYQKYIPEASGHYFTEHLPDGWDTWDEKELNEWCEEHAWEPFEYHPTDWVFEQAWNLAVRIHTCVEKATESLEHAVAECEQEIDNLRGRLNASSTR